MVWVRITDHLGNYGLSHNTVVPYTIIEEDKNTILNALDLYLEKNFKANLLTEKRNLKKKR
jgi:hypothetical protein